MKLLKDKILKEGKALNSTVLKVDSFINHQVDPVLMKEIGDEYARYYKNAGITKVLTIESSGIAPAVFTALALDVPLVILKKQASKILKDSMYQTPVTSFTKGVTYDLTMSRDYVGSEDTVIIIDDFIANGEAALGAVRLCEMAGTKVAGVGILIEKSFQPGRQRLIEAGYDVYSLARISKLDAGCIEFVKE